MTIRTALVVLLLCLSALAQDEIPTRVTQQNRSGDLPFQSTVGTDVEKVDIATGNLTLHIPLVSVPGRGMGYAFSLEYDARFLVVASRSMTPAQYHKWNVEHRNYFPAVNEGLWFVRTPHVSYSTHYSSCPLDANNQPGGSGNGFQYIRGSYIFHDLSGAKHSIPFFGHHDIHCNGQDFYAENQELPDSSGEGIWMSSVDTNVFLADGTLVQGGGSGGASYLDPNEATVTDIPMGNFTDANGNRKQEYLGGADTLGRPVVTRQDLPNQVLLKFFDASGTQQTVTVSYISASIATAFGVAGIYGPIQEYSGTRKAISSIVLPNGTSYSFQYDNYGTITQLTLPSGATISYGWQNRAQGDSTTRVVQSRTVTADGQTATWNFDRSQSSLCVNAPDCVLLSDPTGNQSVYAGNNGRTVQVRLYQGTAA